MFHDSVIFILVIVTVILHEIFYGTKIYKFIEIHRVLNSVRSYSCKYVFSPFDPFGNYLSMLCVSFPFNAIRVYQILNILIISPHEWL